QSSRLRRSGSRRRADVRCPCGRTPSTGGTEPGDQTRRAGAGTGPPRPDDGPGVCRRGCRRHRAGRADPTGPGAPLSGAVQLTIIAGALAAGLAGWVIGGYACAAVGLVMGVAVGVIRWRGQPAWSWLNLWCRRRRPITLIEPLTVANDRAGGGV